MSHFRELYLNGAPLHPGMNMIPFGTKSKVYYVDGQFGDDNNEGTDARFPLATVSEAHDRMTAGRNDVCFLIGSGTSSSTTSGSSRDTATIAWSKHMCHLIGVSSGSFYSQRSRISPNTTTFTPLMTVTGDGCLFANIQFYQNYATDAANDCIYLSSCNRNVFINCHIAGGGHATGAGNASMRSLNIEGDGSGSGGEHYFKNCVIGLDTVARDAATAEIEFDGATMRNTFEDCLILARTTNSGAQWVICDATGIDRNVIFKNCTFWNDTVGGGTAMGEGFDINGSTPGYVLLQNCTTFGPTALETSASGKLYISQETDAVADVNAA